MLLKRVGDGTWAGVSRVLLLPPAHMQPRHGGVHPAPWPAHLPSHAPCLQLRLCFLQVREYFGIPRRPDATSVDAFNMLAATMFFCYALWIVVTGRKV